MKLDLGLIKACKSWKTEVFAQKKLISNIIKETLVNISAFEKLKGVEIAVLLTDNNKMQELNLEFRGKNTPTNVLSFPDTEIKPSDLLEFCNSNEYIYIGDIAIGYDIVKQEAMDLNITMQDHFSHLIVHGILHLIGYDHMNDKEAEEMMNLEIKILKKLNIENPYK